MIALAAPIRRKRRKVWNIVCKGLLLAAIAALLYQAVRIVLAATEGKLSISGQSPAWWALALAASIYLLSHLLRILRLALLVGNWHIGFRKLGSFHFMTAAVSLMTPLKLGEVYRVLELSHLTGGIVRAVVIVWWERAFDMAAILLLISVVAIGSSTAAANIYGVASLVVAFILMTVIVVMVLPENLHRLSVFIIRRYENVHTISLLRLIDILRRSIEEAPRVVRWKLASLATLTGLIWTFEAACFAIVFPALSGTLEAVLNALLAFLSAVALGETLLGDLAAGHDTIRGRSVLFYMTVTQIPLAFLGVVAAGYYTIGRLRR
jgi:uncharacterized membrane protein YbhN (UPF0104 family)